MSDQICVYIHEIISPILHHPLLAYCFSICLILPCVSGICFNPLSSLRSRPNARRLRTEYFGWLSLEFDESNVWQLWGLVFPPPHLGGVGAELGRRFFSLSGGHGGGVQLRSRYTPRGLSYPGSGSWRKGPREVSVHVCVCADCAMKQDRSTV